MSGRAIVAYEAGLRGPEPVVYFDEIPNLNGKPVQTIASHVIEGGTGHAEFFPGVDETLSLAPCRRLVVAFPPPAPAALIQIEDAR